MTVEPLRLDRSASLVRTVLNCAASDVCVDLGTAAARVLFRGERTVYGAPTVVALRQKTGEQIYVGGEAAIMEGRAPRGFEVLHPLEGGLVIHLGEAVSVVRGLFERRPLASRSPRVLVGVPLEATGLERQAILAVARAAGAREVALVPQPLAAACGAGLAVLDPRGRMVVDFGAGKVQAAVLSLGGIAVGRTLRLGGQALDAAIWRWLRYARGLSVGPLTAEQVKWTLACALPHDPPRTMRVAGLDAARGAPGAVDVTSDEICEALRPVLDAAVDLVRRVLDETPPELAADLCREGMVLTGGGALLPRLDDLLAQRTGLEVRVAGMPAACTVVGLEPFFARPGLRWTGARRRALPLLTSRIPRARRWALAATAASLAVVLVVPSVTGAAAGVLSPLEVAAASLSAPPSNPQRLADEVRRLNAENARLQADGAENRDLRRLLRWSRESPWPQHAAPIIARSPSDWLGGITLGARAPVGAVVATADGLVGTVSETAAGCSRVRLLTDAKSVVPCVVGDPAGGSLGVLYGTGGPQCEVRYLDPDAAVRPGDAVRASGLNGTYPRGLALGRVVSVGRRGVFKTAVVQPAARLDEMTAASVMERP